MDFSGLEVDEIWMHRLFGFCPAWAALNALNNLPSGSKGGVIRPPDIPTESHCLARYPLHEWPSYDGANWSMQSGFQPTLSVGPSVATYWDGECVIRVFRQGLGSIRHSRRLNCSDDVIENVPCDGITTEMVTRDGRKGEPDIGSIFQRFEREWLRTFPEIEFDNHHCKMFRTIDPDDPINRDVPSANSSGDAATFRQESSPTDCSSYEVVELVCSDTSAFRALTSEQAIEPRLLKSVVYLLGRSYALTTERTLATVADEINLGAFGQIIRHSPEGASLHNLSQSTRAFVALGPRGAVIAYSAQSGHPYLRAAALNFIEILRARFHGLLVTRTLLDNTIRDLAAVAMPSDAGTVEETKLEGILRNMMRANYRYGLAVSDPGAYLLDGSMLSALAAEADSSFHLKELREDTERKMNALQRFWQEYQDRRRAQIVRMLSK